MATGVRAKELVLENFKSFGTKTRIPLKDGFTTISGPNGSGKSNLLDSLLFVLGLSSSKQLRAERLPDLITNQKGKTQARVALTLLVPQEDGSENTVEIARAVRITPAGYVSTYYLDGKAEPLTKIHDALNELGIGAQGGNVVLQGDVTRIITMSNLERRKLIDELAGVAEFDRKIDQAEGEMTKADRHMEDCRLISGELASRLETLEEERAQALRHQQLEQERDVGEVQLLRAEIQEVERKAEGFRNDEAELIETEKNAVENLPKVETRIEKARESLAEIEEQLRNIGEGEKLEKLRSLEELKAKATTVRAEVHHAEGLQREGERRARSLGSGIEKATRERTEADAARVGAEAAAEKARGEERAAIERQEVLRNTMAEVASDSRAKVEELHERKDKARTLHVKLEGARTELQHRKEAKTRLDSQAVEVEEELRELAARLTSLHELVGDADGVREDLHGRAQESQELVAALKKRRQELLDRKSDLEDEIRPLIRQTGAAEAAQKSGAEGAALAMLRDAGITGVIGDVGSLLQYPADLELALRSSAGARMRNIVVEDDAVAARCIEFLRKQKGPRTTLLPLNKIRGKAVTSFIDDPGLEDYLINLVSFEDRFLPAMEYVLGTAVLASSLEAARRYLGRHRMVTREGDLLDRSGAMTGGGDQKRSGGRANLSGLRTKLAAKEREARKVMDELRTVERRIHEAEEGRETARTRLVELDRELHRDKHDRDALLDRRIKLKKRLEEFKVEIAGIQGELDEKAKAEGKVAGELASLEAKVAALAREVEGGEAARLGDELEQLRETAEAQRTEAARLAEEARHKELEAGYLARSIEGWEKELAEVISREAELKTKIAERRKEASQIEEQISVLDEELQGLSGEIEALRTEREKRSKALESLFSRRASVEAKIAVAREQLSGVRAKVAELSGVSGELAVRLEERGGVPEGLPDPPSLPKARRELDRVLEALREMGPVNLLAVEQYEKLDARRRELEERLAVLETEKQELRDRIERFADLKKEAFMEAFTAVDTNFREIYGDLSEGAGLLELEKAEDPFAGGLTLKAQPRHKNMERLEALSGGEKSLAALAFIFSLQGYRPAPFYVFDEVDMFLDGRNTERLADMIKRRAEGTQFLVVSLRKAMLKRSFRTIGVTPGPGGFTRVSGIEYDPEKAAIA